MEPAFMELLGSIPTTWDTTIIPQAKAGAYIITVRHQGNDCFIGGITDSTARDANIKLDFLGQGNYAATICKDGINADRNAMDYVIEKNSVNCYACRPKRSIGGLRAKTFQLSTVAALPIQPILWQQ
jgi:alpha-glucosidase